MLHVHYVSEKRVLLNFGNNWQFLTDGQKFSTIGKRMKFPTKLKNFHHTSIVLLHYLVQCTSRYYCTVNNIIFHAAVHRYFEHTTGRHAIDDATGSVCHQVDVKAVWCGDMNSGHWCCLLQKLDSVANTGRVLSCWTLSQQLASGTLWYLWSCI